MCVCVCVCIKDTLVWGTVPKCSSTHSRPGRRSWNQSLPNTELFSSTARAPCSHARIRKSPPDSGLVSSCCSGKRL